MQEMQLIEAYGHACAEAARAPLIARIAELEQVLSHTIQKPFGPEVCPFTGRSFWGNIEHPELGVVATYGGPFDTYTLPERDSEDQSFHFHRYDHDAGSWTEGVHSLGAMLVDDQLYTSKDDPAEMAAERDRLRAEVEALRDHLRDHLRAAVACQNSVVETRGADGMDRLSFANDKARALLAQPATPWVNPLAAEVSSLRRLLFNAYTAPGMGYTDDGELQDSTVHPPIDFLRMTPEQIQEAIRRREGKGGRLGELAAEVEKYRADAERYRWLRDSEDFDTLAEVFEFTPATGWDERIDAAIAARKGEGVAGA